MVRQSFGRSEVDYSLGDQANWVPQTSLMCSIAMTSLLLKSQQDERCNAEKPGSVINGKAIDDKIIDVDEETSPTEAALVDIDPLEGRRRGEHLLSMLSAANDMKLPTPSRAPAPNPRHRLFASAPPFRPTQPEHPTNSQSNPEDPPPPWQGSFSGFGSPAIATYSPIVSSAASSVFGEDLLEMESDSGQGFILRLGGEWKERDPWAILEALSGTLWPHLGQEVLSLEPHIIPRRTWLSMRLVDVANLPKDQCWNFVRTGGRCPRGQACRWAHRAFPTQTLDVEVVV